MKALHGSLALPESKKMMLFADLCDARGCADAVAVLEAPVERSI